MSFYTPHIPHHCSSNHTSPSLHTPSPIPSGSIQLPPLPCFEHSPVLLESNDSFKLDHSSGSLLFQNGYTNGANEHVIALQNQVGQLQVELVQAKTAYSTLEAAFRELARNVQLINTDPRTFTSTSISQNSLKSQVSLLEKDDYPDVKFWTRADWDKWQTTSQGLGQKGKHGPVPFLEDENGMPITDEIIDAIRKTVRSLWFEFAIKGLLPLTWSKLIHSTRSLFHSIIEEKYTLFRLASDGWKLDLLCSTSYPSWRKNHLDADGNPVKHRDSKKVKHEDDGDIESDTRGKKRICSPKLEAESASKRFKVGSVPSPLTDVKLSMGPAETIKAAECLIELSTHPLETRAVRAAERLQVVEATESAAHSAAGPCNVQVETNAAEDSTTHPAPDAPNPPIGTVTTTSNPEEQLPAFIDPVIDPALLEDSHSALSPDSDEEHASVACLSLPGPLTRPPVILISPFAGSTRRPIINPVTPNASSTNTTFAAGTTMTPAACMSGSTITPLPNNIPDAVSKKHSKMRPGPKKNGRNLCAFRWLKQVNVVGSTKEFNTYYSQLDAEQIKSYDTAATQLEHEGRWIKNSDISDGAMY